MAENIETLLASDLRTLTQQDGQELAWFFTEQILKENPNTNSVDPTLPIFRFIALSTIHELKSRHDAGDRSAHLQAIGFCAQHDLIIPRWAGTRFNSSLHKAAWYKVKDWGELFGEVIEKGKHIASARKKKNLRLPACLRVEELRKTGRAIDDLMFEDVGKEFGIGKTLVGELYYSLKEMPIEAVEASLDEPLLETQIELLQNLKISRQY